MIIILLIAILLLTNCPLQTIGYVEEVVDVRSVVMIIAQDNFRDEELLQPKQVLEKAGIVVKVASRKKAKAKGMLGASVMPDMVLEEINVQDLAAICIAPVTLARAGLLKGRKTTVWSSEAGKLKAAGAVYTGKSLERDGNIITASGPTAAIEFGSQLLKVLSETQTYGTK